MQFNVNYKHPVQPNLIDYTDHLILMGSCFTENIGEKLTTGKFNCTINPNGILFNPISVATALLSYINNAPVNEQDIVFNNGLYSSLNHHGSFSSVNKNDLLEKIKTSVQHAHIQLKSADYLIITFGSSTVYSYNATSQVAGNCHKLPQNRFTKEQLQPGEIINLYNQVIDTLKSFNTKLKIIFTVSPVKYLRDGIIENNLSKAVLIYSVHEIIKYNSHCRYFPAYELVCDDLRDYRFYKEDMAHPNEQAIQYVWEQFIDSSLSLSAKATLQKVNEITRAAAHRPLHGNTESHLQFKKTYLQKCEQLEREIPGMNFTHEKTILQTNL